MSLKDAAVVQNPITFSSLFNITQQMQNIVGYTKTQKVIPIILSCTHKHADKHKTKTHTNTLAHTHIYVGDTLLESCIRHINFDFFF